jgi:hypothetical protein
VRSNVSVDVLDPAEYAAWEKLVATSPDGSIYASPRYLDALCSAAGGRFRILAARRAGELVGGSPLYERDSRLGSFVSPRLLLYYLGPVLRRSESKYPSQQTARNLETLGALAEALSGLGHAQVTLRTRHTVADIRPFLQAGWSCSPSYTYLVSLSDLPRQWGRVEQNLRRLVERCAAEGVGFTDDDDFESFLALHRLTMSHHGAATYLPDDAFRVWFHALHRAGLCRLFQARLPDGQVVAAQIVLLGDHPVSHTVSAAIDPAHRRLGAAAFLRWRAFEWLGAHGKTSNDLTDAALGSVTHFKSQLGGDLVTNFVVRTSGTVVWRAGHALESGYWRARQKAGALARRGRGGNGT